MLFDQNMIIDATTRGSIARFVNHSCNPSCRMEKWTVGGQPRMALFAGERGIMTGEELTYDYNFDPYSLKNVQACRCGERGCRGVLGPKPKEEKEKKVQKEETEGKLKGVKRKIVEVVEERLASKRRKVDVKEIKTAVRSPRVSASPKKTKVVNANVKLIKKGIRRSSAPISLQRKPSKLKRMLSGTKSRAAEAKERAAGRRVVSAASAREMLIDKESNGEAGSAKVKGKMVKIPTSLKDKVGSIRKGVVRSVRR
jgi:[histone H3]-lysine4 N-trimethyltransferase ASH1L